MIPKPGKLPKNKTSYLPISLLPFISNVFDKLLLICLGFRNKHSGTIKYVELPVSLRGVVRKTKNLLHIILGCSPDLNKVWLVHKMEI